MPNTASQILHKAWCHTGRWLHAIELAKGKNRFPNCLLGGLCITDRCLILILLLLPESARLVEHLLVVLQLIRESGDQARQLRPVWQELLTSIRATCLSACDKLTSRKPKQHCTHTSSLHRHLCNMRRACVCVCVREILCVCVFLRVCVCVCNFLRIGQAEPNDCASSDMPRHSPSDRHPAEVARDTRTLSLFFFPLSLSLSLLSLSLSLSLSLLVSQ